MTCPNCGKYLPEGAVCDCLNTAAQPEHPQTPKPNRFSEPPQYNPVPYQIQPTNGLATAGFVLALIALFFGWVPIFGWALWLTGLVFSIIGYTAASRRDDVGRGFGIAGLVLSIISAVIILISIARFIAFA